ncbi:hypothetical protein FGF1_07270 [Flavobacteriaceae bacterium GF1]
MTKTKMIFTALFITLSSLANGQSIFILDEEGTKIHVDGSSNVSDWQLDVQGFQGELQVNDSVPLELGSKFISKLTFSAPADKMTGGRGPIMDKKVQNALKFEQYPQVNYAAISNEVTEANGNEVTMVFHGILKMAGEEKNIDVNVKAQLSNDGKTLKMQGSKPLKLSAFNIERPTAFFGQLSTDDDITIQLDLTFIKQS